MQSFQIKDLIGKTNEECFTDKTTHLNNITGLSYLVKHILKQHKRYEENWSLVAILIDYKHNCASINQDKIYIKTAEILKNICRDSDILTFCSNSTFCILSRVFEGDDTARFAQKIKKHLQKIELNGCTINSDIKFGITFSRYNDTASNIFTRIERALNKAHEIQNDIVVEI